jgi:hypothetical protein
MMRQGLFRGLKKPVISTITGGGSGALLRNSIVSRTFSSTLPVAVEVEITVDGKKVKIEQGAALIQACEKAGIVVPRYCYHVRFFPSQPSIVFRLNLLRTWLMDTVLGKTIDCRKLSNVFG